MNDMQSEIIELVKVWFFLKTQYEWPEALSAVEDKLNELFAKDQDEWIRKSINNALLN